MRGSQSCVDNFNEIWFLPLPNVVFKSKTEKDQCILLKGVKMDICFCIYNNFEKYITNKNKLPTKLCVNNNSIFYEQISIKNLRNAFIYTRC